MRLLKSRIISSLLFVAVGLLLLGSIFYLINKGARHSDFEQIGKVNKIVNHSVDPQLVVFGSSVSEVGIDPGILNEKTGLSAFNCSITGTRFKQYKGLIDEFNSYSKNDEYVLLVETYFSFEKVDAMAQAENFLPQINNDHIFKSLYAIQPDVAWRCRYVPGYMFTVVTSRYYKNVAMGWKNIIKGTGLTDINTGYSPVDRKWEADADEAIKNTPPFRIQLDAAIISDYVNTIQSLVKSGRKVILVLTPTYTTMLRRITDISPLREKLKNIALNANGVRFIDFSQSQICDNKDFFYNSNHLNLAGSRVFSQALGDTLAHIIKASAKNIN